MADWSWKRAVADRVLEIVNEKTSPTFTLEEVYAYTKEFSELFPRNTRIRPKVRQILQRLRDDEGFLTFLGEGHYSLNLEYEELQGEPALPGQTGVEFPVSKRVLRKVRLRDTFLAADMKRRYRNICQVCRAPVLVSENRCYAEGHHLKPLGSPHLGPDVLGNIIILCPNHHVMFDRGAATAMPETLELCHRASGVFQEGMRLYVEPWHTLNPKYLEYHHRRFCGSLA